MKYCIPFFVGMNSKKDLGELIIKYKEDRYDTLIDFLKEHFYLRVIVNMLDRELTEEDINFFAALAEKEEYNFAILLSYHKNKSFINRLKETKIKYFFQEYCVDYSSIRAFLDAGVSDIYVTNDLGFDIINVANMIHSAGAKVRIFPNVAQEMFSTKDTVTRFFIRPEDIHLYENYIDVCEIFGEAGITEDIFYIYAAEKWGKEINKLISNLNESFTNTFLLDNFALKRLSCKRKCKTTENCDFCMKKVKIAKGIDKIRQGGTKILN